MLKTILTAKDILNLLPQQNPFRFVDEIVSFNENEIQGSYTFKEEEVFYAGHFPNKPVTPGVILLEAMGQLGVVAFGIYLLSLEQEPEQFKDHITLLTDAQIECFKVVYPKDKIIMIAEKLFWRRMKLRSKINMYDEHENLIATAIASGIGVKR